MKRTLLDFASPFGDKRNRAGGRGRASQVRRIVSSLTSSSLMKAVSSGCELATIVSLQAPFRQDGQVKLHIVGRLRLAWN